MVDCERLAAHRHRRIDHRAVRSLRNGPGRVHRAADVDRRRARRRAVDRSKSSSHRPARSTSTALLGGQVTGGSTSVRDAWEKLRMAGAEARMRLITAAAKEWGAPPQSCSVADGYVVFTSRRKSFGELAEAAAALPKPENVQLKATQRVQVHRQAAEAPGYAGEGRRQRAVRHRRALAGHAVRRAGAAAGARRERQELQGRRRAGNAGRASRAADVVRRRRDRRLVVAGEAGARCAADRVDAGHEREADELPRSTPA